MKIPHLFLVLLVGSLPLCGQESAALSDGESLDSIADGISPEPARELEPNAPPDDVADASLAKRTFIPHPLEVKPFTPPPPPVVKRLPAVRVDAETRRLSKNSRTLTLQRGEASTQPDLPPPPPAPPRVEPCDPTPE